MTSPQLRLAPLLLLLAVAGGPASDPPVAAPVGPPAAVGPPAPADEEVYTLQEAYDLLLRWGRRARFGRHAQLEDRARRLRDRLEGAHLRARGFPVHPNAVRFIDGSGGPAPTGDASARGPGPRDRWTYCVVAPDWSGEAYATGVPSGCVHHDLPLDFRLPRWEDLFQLIREDCRRVVATDPRSPVVRTPRPLEGCMRGLLVRLWDPTGRLAGELTETEGPVKLDLRARVVRAGLVHLFSGRVQRAREEPYTLIVALLELQVTGWERSR